MRNNIKDQLRTVSQTTGHSLFNIIVSLKSYPTGYLSKSYGIFFFLFFDNQKLRYSYSSNKSQLNSPVGLDKLPRESIRRDSREVIGKITSKQNVHATRKGHRILPTRRV